MSLWRGESGRMDRLKEEREWKQWVNLKYNKKILGLIE